MALSGSLHLSHELGLCRNHYDNHYKGQFQRSNSLILRPALSSLALCKQQDPWSIRLSRSLSRPIHVVPYRNQSFRCHSFLASGESFKIPVVKAASEALTRSYNVLERSPLIFKLVSATGIILFAVWGLEPLMKKSRNLLLHKNDNSWKKSSTYYVMSSYIQPFLLWTGAIFICRTLDPVVLQTEARQVVKERLVNFVRSLSTVLAFSYCLSSIIQQAQKFFMESNEPDDARNMGFQFAGKAVYSAVWVAAASLFMELLGFSTQKWLTAGGLGTVLLTLAGREIFTNFLSSVMIHATRPFVVNEWIQTKIEGFEVSGTVEHVGWWSPTIIRGEDREAIHIPNHKLTMNVVRNLSQKSHWRIKTHLAISHMDAHKINNIVADMRKVLSKNSQVEQKKFHRRVFFDNINRENQGLLILVSCFVKTSRHEEYLCVKEAILLDLLRVISHHKARLATPIRTVQKILNDADFENVPFSDSFYNRGGMASNRPLLLIEPSYKINGEDKGQPVTRSGHTAGEQDRNTVSQLVTDNKTGGSRKSDSRVKETPKSDTRGNKKTGETVKSDPKENMKAAPVSASELKVGDKMTVKSSPDSSLITSSNATEESGASLKEAGYDNFTENQRVSGSKQYKSTMGDHVREDSKLNSAGGNSSEEGIDGVVGLPEASQPKQDKKSVSQSSMSRPGWDENIVLGVALEGSKRTLPIDEDMDSLPTPAMEKEKASVYGNGTDNQSAEKNRKDGQTVTPPGATVSEQ